MLTVVPAAIPVRPRPGPVLYDEDGEVLEEIGTFLGVATDNVAEWTGLVEGLKAALARGVGEIAVRLDTELVVKQLSRRVSGQAPGADPAARPGENAAAQVRADATSGTSRARRTRQPTPWSTRCSTRTVTLCRRGAF